MAYLRGRFVPEDEKEEKQLTLRARSYSIVNDTLYRGCLRTVAEIYFTSRRQAAIARNSRRNVLFAHRNEGSGGKSFPRRVLLAFGRGRRP